MPHLAAWELLDAATATRKLLLQAGYRPLPAIGKAIAVPGWTDIAATEGIIDNWSRQFPEALNTGALTRNTPVIDVDITDEAAATAVEGLAREQFEERGCFLVRFGNAPKRAIPLRTDQPFKKLKLSLAAPNGSKAEIEILGDGQQFIVDGVHPETRLRYRWHGGELWTSPPAELPYVSEEQARQFLRDAEKLLVDQFAYTPIAATANAVNGEATADALFDQLYGSGADWPTLVERLRTGVELHDTLCSLSMSAVAGGMHEGAAVRLLQALMLQTTAPRDARWQDRFDDIPRTVVSAIKKRGATDTHESKNTPEHSWVDPDISILDDRRGDLPEFPLDVFPADCRDWVDRSARGAGVSPAHVAVPLLGIASGLIGTARRARASTSFSQPCTIWAAIVGSSGSGKTPGIDTVKRALVMIERLKKNGVAERQHAHEAKVEAAKAARAVWKRAVEDAASGPVVDLNTFRSAPPLPPEAIIPPPFVAPRLFVTDATIERLAVLLTAKPRGMLLIGDELAGLFLNMSRYSNGSDREFWLEAWNGGSYVVERMSRDPIMVDHLLVGLVGGLQPDKLARSFSGDHDGLYARVLFAWPAEPSYHPLSNEIAEVEPEIINALTRLIDLDDGGNEAFAPLPVPLTADAVAVFEDLRKLSHHDKQSLDDGRERDWVSKTQAHVLRLAITLEYLDWAFRGGDEPRHVSERSTAAAIGLVHEYFWPHARAALRQIGLSGRHANARRVLRWLAAEQRTEFSREDIRLLALGRTQDAEQTQALIDGLVKAGWCQEVTERPAVGRPARRWAVSPKLGASV